MRPLERLEIVNRAKDAGRPPEMAWIEIAKLVIDDAYQRNIESRGRANILRIAAEFQWNKFSPVIVVQVSGGRYAIIDGQHRTTAALSLDYSKVPCYIVKTSPQEAAAIFAAVNGNVTGLNPPQIYRAALAAGEAWAVQINDVCAKAGTKACTSKKTSTTMGPLETIAIQALRNALRLYPPQVLEFALKGFGASIDGQKPGLLTSKRINFFVGLMARHQGWLSTPEHFLTTMAAWNLWFCDWAHVEAGLVRVLGKGDAVDAQEWASIVARVEDYHGRKFSASMIASIMKIPHAFVERAIAQIKAKAS